MTCSQYSFSLCVFYENNKQYFLVFTDKIFNTSHSTHVLMADSYLQASAHSALGAADNCGHEKGSKLLLSAAFLQLSGRDKQSASLVMLPTSRNAEIFQGSELHLSNHWPSREKMLFSNYCLLLTVDSVVCTSDALRVRQFSLLTFTHALCVCIFLCTVGLL